MGSNSTQRILGLRGGRGFSKTISSLGGLPRIQVLPHDPGSKSSDSVISKVHGPQSCDNLYCTKVLFLMCEHGFYVGG
ncbi:hypothetical protein R6Q59_036601 [Mikania micrantha]